MLIDIVKRLLPDNVRRRLVRLTRYPSVGRVNFGDLRTVKPISSHWGFDRGTPVDRYYIEQFISSHATDIRGHVLEVADNAYTMRFGREQLSRSDILHNKPGHPKATVVADLTNAPQIERDTYDCVICTQTLQLIYDLPAAIHTLHRILKPKGVLLATVPGITKISPEDMEATGDFWRFTTASATQLFGGSFPTPHVTVTAHGNVLAATAFLHGLSATELSSHELDSVDPEFQTLITVRATKPETS